MGKKEKIIFLILIVMIVIVTLIVFSIKTLKKNSNNEANIVSNNSGSANIKNNDRSNGNTNTSQNFISYKDVNKNEINLNEVDFENSDYIFYHEEQAAEVPYSREHLNNYKFNIENVPENVLNLIADRNEFYLTIKEFIYKNGLVSTTKAEYVKYDFNQEENNIVIYFNLNDILSTKLKTKVNLNNNSIEVSIMK